MSLRLRRGTNSERLTITPAEGELIYTTDTKKVFVGDSATLGGVDVSTTSLGGTLGENLNISFHSITNGTNLTIDGATGIITCASFDIGNISFDNLTTGAVNSTSIVNTGSLTTSSLSVTNISTLHATNILGTAYIDNALTSNGIIYANWGGGLTSGAAILPGSAATLRNNTFDIGSSAARFRNVYGNNLYASNVYSNYFAGRFDGDLTGSLYTDNSTLVINGQTGQISTDHIAFDNQITLENRSTGANSTLVVLNTTENRSTLKLRRTSSTTVASTSIVGQIAFETNENGVFTTHAQMSAYPSLIRLSQADVSGVYTETNVFTLLDNGNNGFGTYTPNYKLEVNGTFAAQSIRSFGYVRTGSYSTTGRNALSPVNGMIIYNTITNQMESYENGVWGPLGSSGPATSLGNISVVGSTLTTTDSSGFIFNAMSDFTSNVNIDSDLHVMNNIYCDSVLSTNPGVPELTSANDLKFTAENAVIVTKSPFRLASFTTTVRDTLISRNGDMIYNTTDNKFQGYQNGAWVNLS